VARAFGLVLLVGLLVAGCGVRTSKPYTAKGTAPCLAKKGFTGVSRKPVDVGFIAGFADNGGLKGTSPTGNVLTIAFTADSDSVASTEAAFKNHAPKSLRPHITDIMQTNRNAVLVWTITPKSDELDAVQRCLQP
jgi:hypothetical protein